MIVSDKYKFVFVHAAKTGGTSVHNALNSVDGVEWVRHLGNKKSKHFLLCSY